MWRKEYSLKFIAAATAMAASFLAGAAPISYVVDTSILQGISGALVFNLIDGGPPSNSVTITGISTDGSLGVATVTGDVLGIAPGPVSMTDSVFFSEFLQSLTFGMTLRFSLEDTGNAPTQGSFPDGLSIYLLDDAGTSLISTTDPSGGNALFVRSIGGTPDELYSSAEVSIHIGDISNVSEPRVWFLMSIAITGLLIQRLRRTQLHS